MLNAKINVIDKNNKLVWDQLKLKVNYEEDEKKVKERVSR
jgi:hypothetical protein